MNHIVFRIVSIELSYTVKCMSIDISKAFAGVGIPINVTVCLVSRLKIASLRADASVINNGVKERSSRAGVICVPERWELNLE